MKTQNTRSFSQQPHEKTWFDLINRGLLILIVAIIVYLLSSGPVLGLGFWLREQTGYDNFYAVLIPYYPLLALHSTPPFEQFIDLYIEFWVCGVFNTVGPG